MKSANFKKADSCRVSSNSVLLETFWGTVLLLVTLGACFYFSATESQIELSKYRQLFIEPYSLRPEPGERRLFLLFVGSLLPIAWLACKLWSRRIARRSTSPHSGPDSAKASLNALSLSSICVLQFGLIMDSELFAWMLPRDHFDAWFWSACIGIAIAMRWLDAKMRGRIEKRRSGTRFVRSWQLCKLGILCMLISVIFNRLIDVHWTLTLIDWRSLSSLTLAFMITAAMLGEHIPGRIGQFLNKAGAYEQPVNVVLTWIASISIAIVELRKIQGVAFVITDRSKWTSHFEAVFYSISQVNGGRTLLADLPSQYGFYGELLRPWFQLIGLNVLSFSMTMWLLQVSAQGFILWVCWKTIRTPRLFMLAAFSLLALTSGAWHSIALNLVDPYYQYWPLRFIFPALSCLLFWLMLQRHFRWQWLTVCGLVSGLAMVWNIDSGIPTFGSLVAFILYRFWVPERSEKRSRWICRGLFFVTCAAAVVVVFVWALDAKSGHRIHLEDAFKYQTLFYQLGFYMLPMPLTPSPWMVVLAYYVFGVVYAIQMRMNGKGTRHVDLVFYLSILGIGLFSYYQGRSHELNLLVVMWPAVMVGFILADRNLRLIKARLLPARDALLALPVLAFGGLCLWILVLGLSSLVPKAVSYLDTVFSDRVTPVMKNIEFIKSKVTDTKEVAILAPHQAVYFAEAGLVSAVKGPGLAEIALVQDRQHVIDQITSTPIKHLFVQRRIRDDIDFAAPYTAVFRSYQLEGESEAGLQHWIPLPKGKPAAASN